VNGRWVERLPLLLLLCALFAPITPAGDARFCDALQRVIRSAEAQDRLAEIAGNNAGLYFETGVDLPGAQFCVSDPDDYPDASWSCMVSSNGKYVIALQKFGKVVRRVEQCLPPGWSKDEPATDDYLSETVFTHEDSVARVRVIVTNAVERVRSWHAHRIVITVFSPRTDVH